MIAALGPAKAQGELLQGLRPAPGEVRAEKEEAGL